MKTDRFFSIKKEQADLRKSGDKEILELLTKQDLVNELKVDEEMKFIIVSSKFDTILMAGVLYRGDGVEHEEWSFVREWTSIDADTMVVFLED